MSTLTAIACVLSLMHFESTPSSNTTVFAIHALVFISLGTMWFHLFGRPSLVGWFGTASPQALEREREKFRAESEQPLKSG